ncbi:MAG: lytic transglycosylase domain-containing protein [Sulfurimonas sp.]|jgi:soluble lytic murein transglycosylase-like protein|nr:lytic transglycosylase domain-containing protein [Sulfurimonadaceae bacterium]
MKRVILFVFLLTFELMASKNIWIATGQTYGIEPRLLYAISKVESNIAPLVIALNHKKTPPAKLNKLTKALSISKIPYKKYQTVLQIHNQNTQQAKAVIAYLDTNGYESFDIGLMQINSIHKESLAKKNIPLDALLDEKLNISVAAEILWNCYKKHGTKEEALNAYNGKVKNNDYYKKVLAELDKLLLPHEKQNKKLFFRVM